MANVKLLRQQVTDYQRKYGLNRRNYEKSYEKYAADTEAFNTLIQNQYNASAAMNKKSDLDLVGATYYDRELGTNVAAGGTTNPLGTKVFEGFTPVEGAGHNAYASFVPGTSHTVEWTDGEGNRYTESVIDTWNAVHNGQVIGSIPASGASGVKFGMSQEPFNVPYYAPANSIGAYWDDYDKVWRNAASGGAAPTQRQTKAPNLTQKEVGILQGEVSPHSYADIAKQDTSPTSAFADPEDPYNLKDSGVLTRAIAGKI